MPCHHPLNAYRHPHIKTASGKAKIVITGQKKPLSSSIQDWLVIPCGQCVGCKITKTKEWAIRCVHEASLYSENCFLTLTYNDECMPKDGSLHKPDFQNFMKRFRKQYQGTDAVDREIIDKHTGEVTTYTHYPIRFFHCGEYGSNKDRPHYHACVFNYDFPDKELLTTQKGVKLYVSEMLEELWSKEVSVDESKYHRLDNLWYRNGRLYVKLGYCRIGSVTTDSAAYVAGYIHKKIGGDPAWDHYLKEDPEGNINILQPEYITMSRNPGIARDWIKNNLSDAYPKDFVTSKGKKFKVPKYYDAIYDQCYPEALEQIKLKRKEKAIALQESPERLAAMEKCAILNRKRIIRSYEDAS